jgi:hypothetical protein
LVLTAISPGRVQFEHRSANETRNVLVIASSNGRPQFPTSRNAWTASLGDDRLDDAVRRRAGEELVRLHGAIEALDALEGAR